jgi:hypothetical protein
MRPLTPEQEQLCAGSRWDFTDLLALYISCTLKRRHPGTRQSALGVGCGLAP